MKIYDSKPLNRCLPDVAAANVYMVIVAWRYGYIPRISWRRQALRGI